MKKKDLSLILGIIIVLIGVFLPAIKIANENINFLKENGCLMVIIAAIMFILYKLNKKNLIILPSLVSIFITIKFVFDNQDRLKQINELYNCYADFRYGLLVMIIGNLITILTIVVTAVNYNRVLEFIKYKLIIFKNFIVATCIKVKEFLSKIKPKKYSKTVKTKTNKATIVNRLGNLKTKRELDKNILTQEKKDNGVVKYNKMVVKLNDKKVNQKITIKEKLQIIRLSLKSKRTFNKKISITKFKNEYQETVLPDTKKLVTYQVPVIDITKWTRNDICCINCGATVSSNSEYCFLCDCKVKLNEKYEKLS